MNELMGVSSALDYCGETICLLSSFLLSIFLNRHQKHWFTAQPLLGVDPLLFSGLEFLSNQEGLHFKSVNRETPSISN